MWEQDVQSIRPLRNCLHLIDPTNLQQPGKAVSIYSSTSFHWARVSFRLIRQHPQNFLTASLSSEIK